MQAENETSLNLKLHESSISETSRAKSDKTKESMMYASSDFDDEMTSLKMKSSIDSASTISKNTSSIDQESRNSELQSHNNEHSTSTDTKKDNTLTSTTIRNNSTKLATDKISSYISTSTILSSSTMLSSKTTISQSKATQLVSSTTTQEHMQVTTTSTTGPSTTTIDLSLWEIEWDPNTFVAPVNGVYQEGDIIFYARDYDFDEVKAGDAAAEFIDKQVLTKFEVCGGNYYNLLNSRGDTVAWAVHLRYRN